MERMLKGIMINKCGWEPGALHSQDTIQICSQPPCKIKNIIKIFLQAASVLNTHNLAPALVLLPTDVSLSALDRNHFREEGQ